MKTFAFVFVRGGSRGVPGKNIKKFIDKPLLIHTLEFIDKLSEIEHCFVSTESLEIARIAEEFGSTVINRPLELSQDDSSEWKAWQHAIEWTRKNFGNFDRFVSLPVTSPLRIVEDVKKCLAALDERTDVVITVTPAQRSPWFNMVSLNDNGYINLVIDGSDKVTRRQDAPKIFDLTTIGYVLRPDFIMEKQNIWEGKVRSVLIPQERAIDIDTEFDFKIAEFLMRERINKK